jgi:hypothetical protein
MSAFDEEDSVGLENNSADANDGRYGQRGHRQEADTVRFELDTVGFEADTVGFEADIVGFDVEKP